MGFPGCRSQVLPRASPAPVNDDQVVADAHHQDASAEDDNLLPVINHLAETLQAVHVDADAAFTTQAREREPQASVQNAAASISGTAVVSASAGAAERQPLYSYGVPPGPQVQQSGKRDWIRLDEAKDLYKVGSYRLAPSVCFGEPQQAELAVGALQVSDVLMKQFLKDFSREYTRDFPWGSREVTKFWAPAVERFAINRHGGIEGHLAYKQTLAATAIRRQATKEAKRALQASRGAGEAL